MLVYELSYRLVTVNKNWYSDIFIEIRELTVCKKISKCAINLASKCKDDEIT